MLQVAKHGSVARACKDLGMTHATLLRKLDQVESRLKTRLFDRTRGHYELTPAGHKIVEAAQTFEPIARAAEAGARAQDLRPSGEVRVSVAAIVADFLLPPVLAQFASAFPAVQINLATSRDHANIRRREADVAIRVADTVPEWLVGRKLADLRFKIYSRRHSMATSPLRPVETLAAERRWISFDRDARELKFDRWLAERVPEASVVMRVDNFSHAVAMVRAGLGIALLPAFIEGVVADLQPLTAPITELQTPLWLITHPELRTMMRVKVLMRAVGPALTHSVQNAQGEQAGATQSQ